MIIGLVGQKGVGKDTAAAYLIKKHGFERRAFADPLKRSFGKLFDIPLHEVERLKNDPKALISISIPVPDKDYNRVGTMDVREALQRYGVEAHRDIFGQDFWLDATLPVAQFYGGRAIVIPGVRFENEARRIRDLDGVLVRINRPELASDDTHTSETELLDIVANEVIVNDSSIKELYNKIERCLDKLLLTEPLA